MADWTPESVNYGRQLGGRLVNQGIDASPVGHWTQALARVLQAGSGAAWNQQANEGERAGKQGVADIYRQGLEGGKPMSAIAASLMGNPFGADQGQALAKQHMVTAQGQGFQREQQDRQFKQQMQIQGGSQAHAMKLQNMQQQFQLRMMQAKSDMERQKLLEIGRSFGLTMPDAGPAPAPSGPVNGYADNDPARPVGMEPQPTAPQPGPSFVPPGVNLGQGQPPAAMPPADPYQRLVQPTIPREQADAERKKRAATALMMGDPKGAAKIMNKEDDPKEYQTKDALWAERMARAEITMRGNIGTPDNPKYDPGRTANRFWPDDGIMGLGNSEAWRTYQAGAREWIAALLRKDTGAAVTESEWKLYFPTYFPQGGDSAKVQKEKLDRRVAEARKLRASSEQVFDRMNPGFDQEMGERLRMQNQGGAKGPALPPGEYVYDPATGQVRPK